jgi:mannose-6-phosphate isomerase
MDTMKQQKITTTPPTREKGVASVDLGNKSFIRILIWRLRRGARDLLGGHDLLDTEPRSRGFKVRQVYRSVNDFMEKNFPKLVIETPIEVARKMVHDRISELGYLVVEEDLDKPWGAYYRMSNEDAERFISEFFPGLSLTEARLGRDDVELSPKFLLVAPGKRLSWQYHHRRAERWRFLTNGAYYRSQDNTMPGMPLHGRAGEVVQFGAGERHRLCSEPYSKNYTLVAEIWQHTDEKNHSDEADVVRIQDDYKR